MGFQPISTIYLEYNKEYKISNSLRGIYKGRRWTECAYPYTGWGCHLEFENVRRLDKQPVNLSMIISNSISIYEFFSEKDAIQSRMECRAVNLILRKIIGDETFTWVPLS